MANAGALFRGAAFTALAVAAGWLPGMASAQTGLPKFDTVALCAKSASPPICSVAEARAEEQVRPAWAALPSARQALCVTRATGAGGSYIAALACARMP